jgi:hypothetical protein
MHFAPVPSRNPPLTPPRHVSDATLQSPDPFPTDRIALFRSTYPFPVGRNAPCTRTDPISPDRERVLPPEIPEKPLRVFLRDLRTSAFRSILHLASFMSPRDFRASAVILAILTQDPTIFLPIPPSQISFPITPERTVTMPKKRLPFALSQIISLQQK